MSDALLAPSTVDPRLGVVVQDRYRIVKKVGEGGMGAVYQGEHIHIGRTVAIKCLHSQYATDKDMVGRFQREAMAANAIRHPNIVEVTDIGRFDDGGLYQVLEFLEGNEFSDLVDKGALPLSRVVHILTQVCDALQAAHDANIIHRDLKPDNIFLIKRGKDTDFVKLLDFGIAKFKEAGGANMTRTGLTMGTPHYMAPEQAQAAKDLDHRADIYSLGVILFHSITGKLPFDDDSFPMLMVKVVTHAPPRLNQLVPSIPPEIDDLVNRCLAKFPDQRPQSCDEVKDVLARFADVNSSYAAQGLVHTRAMPGVAPPGFDGQTPSPATGPLHVQGSGAQVPPTSYSTPGANQEVAGIGGGPSWVMLGGSAAVVLLGIGIAVVAAVIVVPPTPVDDTPPPVRAPIEDTPAVVPEEPVVEADTRTAPPAASAETVRVQITVLPGEAELFLDGNRIANPFDADLPQQSEPRRLEARLDDHQTVVQDLVLIYAQRVNIELERGEGIDDRRRTRRTNTRRPHGRTGDTMAPTTVPTMAAVSPEVVPPTPAMVVTPPPPPAMATTPPPNMGFIPIDI